MAEKNRFFQFDVDRSNTGRRFDLYLSSILPGCSRSRAAALIRDGHAKVDDAPKKPGYRLQAGERVDGRLPDVAASVYLPEPIPIDILFEDSHLLVLDKRPGMVVHPAPGHVSGTLVNALLHHCTDLTGIGGELRPGIVHRLDKDTSGTMVVAKSEPVLNHLAAQFKKRTVEKTYLALVRGHIKEESGEILLPIGRHQVHRKKMSVQSRHSRTAETRWKIRERYPNAALLEVVLKTGRTHQIRVHCAAIGHPILGDSVYGGRKQKGAGITDGTGNDLAMPRRQMLHAWRLSFVHPVSGMAMSFESPVPGDMAEAMGRLMLKSGTFDQTSPENGQGGAANF